MNEKYSTFKNNIFKSTDTKYTVKNNYVFYKIARNFIDINKIYYKYILLIIYHKIKIHNIHKIAWNFIDINKKYILFIF